MLTSRARVLVGGALALVVLVVLAVVSFAGGSDPSPPSAPGAGPAPAGATLDASDTSDPRARARLGTARRDPGDPLALGRVDAPLVVVEFGDFQCPFCRLFAQNTEPELLRRYVDAGQVRLEWRDYAYLGPESVTAAVAARAAARQGRFWPFHDALYAAQRPENRGAVDEAFLSGIARDVGLDPVRFAADRADPALREAVESDLRTGTSLGITGVPTFLVGDQLIFGAQPLPTFTGAIDAALARAR